MRTSAPSSVPAGRVTGSATPVDVSLCGQQYASTPSTTDRAGAEPAGAVTTAGSARNGARLTAAANFDENSPSERCADRRSIRQQEAISQNTVAPPSPEHDLVAVGQAEQGGHPGADPADHRLHRIPAMRGPEVRRTGRGQRRQRLRPDLRRSRAEPAVPRPERLRDDECGFAHVSRSCGVRGDADLVGALDRLDRSRPGPDVPRRRPDQPTGAPSARGCGRSIRRPGRR